MPRQIIVDIVGKADKFSKSVNEATKSAGGFKSVLQGVGQGIGQLGFGLVTSAVEGLVGSLGDASKAFQEDQVSQAKLGQALKNNIPNWNGSTDAIEGVIASQMRLGFSDDEQRDSLAQLAGVTHSVTEAQDIQSAAMDLARLKGIDLASATDIMIKAHNGNFKGLKSVGVELGKNATFTDALAQVQKIAGGQADAYAETSKGKLAASQLVVGEAMEKLGGIVDKVATVALPILANAFSTIIDVVSSVFDAIQPVIDQIATVLGPVFEQIGKIAQQVFPVIKDVFQKMVAGISAAISFLKPILGTLGDVFRTVLGAVSAAVKALAPVFSTIFGAIGNVIGTAVKVITTGFNILQTAAGVLGKVFSTMADLVGKVFGAIAGFVKAPINFVIGLVNNVIDAINGIQVHIHVGPVDLDWNGLNIGHIPKLHSGGIVPGAPGSDVLTVLQAGEQVIPRSQVGKGNVIINIGTFVGDGATVNKLADRIALEMRLRGAI